MRLTREMLQDKRDAILEVARRNGALDVRVFGSVARGDATDASDLDLIVRFEPGRSLMDWGVLIDELQELLGVHVDVVDEEAMRERFRRHALQEAVPL
jgi:uncharacterized protein